MRGQRRAGSKAKAEYSTEVTEASGAGRNRARARSDGRHRSEGKERFERIEKKRGQKKEGSEAEAGG